MYMTLNLSDKGKRFLFGYAFCLLVIVTFEALRVCLHLVVLTVICAGSNIYRDKLYMKRCC